MIGSPFDAIHANAWQESLDVPSLNAHVTNYIRMCVDTLRKTEFNAIGAPKSTALLLLGPAGSGKTHLFTRLRQQVGCRAIFAHTRPEIGVEQSPRHVLSAVVHALRQPVFGRDERQIDVFVGTMLARATDAPPHFPLAFLADCLGQTIDMQNKIIEQAITRAEDHSADVWPEYLGHLLRLPFADRFEQRALWTWLSGGDPSHLQLERLGERAALRDDDVMMALRTLGVIATFGAPLVLVFDQLENLADEEGRTGRISQYARLVSELRDTVRGLVIVQMALDSVWKERIHSVLQPSMRDRLEERVEYLDAPTAEERLELVRCWLNVLPSELRPEPFPYPFTNEQVEAWQRAPGMTPRMLMQACGETYRSRGLNEVDELSQETRLDERLEGYWQQLLQSSRASIDEAASTGQGIAAETIRGGLLGTFLVAEMNAEATTTDGAPSMVFQMENQDVLVMIVQQAHHRAMAKTLRTALEQAGQRRVVVVREQAFAIPPTWKEVNNLVTSLEKQPNAVWMLVDRESLAKLLAMERFVTSARSQDFTDARGNVITLDAALCWARKNLRCLEWSPMISILGRAPKDKDVEESPSAGDFQEKPLDIHQAQTVHDGAAARVLRKLKIASIERLVREIRASHPVATRASVMSELSRMRVKRFGGSIVALEDLWA
jgi:hypothetical protein